MQRLKDEFFQKVDELVPLAGLTVLEVGCGDGKRTVELAKRCARVVATEPHAVKLEEAKTRRIPNAEFQVGVGEHLEFPDRTFDAVFFTNSFHHVPIEKMSIALAETMRVLRPGGYLVFLEPGEGGSFIAAEEQFEIADGDDRTLIAAAYRTIKTVIGAHVLHDLDDETIFKFESAQDFITSMEPKKNQSQIKDFLEKNNYQMKLDRRIIIAQPKIETPNDLSAYHQKYANLSDVEIQNRADEKQHELAAIFEHTELKTTDDLVEVGVLGCGDKRFIAHHKAIFEAVLRRPVQITTYDIAVEHLHGQDDVVQHDCTLPLTGGPFDITYGHVLLRFIEIEKQWDVLINSYAALKPGGIAIHVLDTEDYETPELKLPNGLFSVPLGRWTTKLSAQDIEYKEIPVKYGLALAILKEDL